MSLGIREGAASPHAISGTSVPRARSRDIGQKTVRRPQVTHHTSWYQWSQSAARPMAGAQPEPIRRTDRPTASWGHRVDATSYGVVHLFLICILLLAVSALGPLPPTLASDCQVSPIGLIPKPHQPGKHSRFVVSSRWQCEWRYSCLSLPHALHLCPRGGRSHLSSGQRVAT